MRYDITIMHLSFDGKVIEKIALVGVSEQMALKVLDIYGKNGYDIKICGYKEVGDIDVQYKDKLWN